MEEGKGEKKLLRLAILLAILGAVSSFLLGLVANAFAFQKYLPASCTILARHSSSFSTSATHPTTYLPSFTYSISAPPDQHATIQGYAGPDPESFSSSGADAVFHAFSPGGTYPCWYPKGQIEKAVLVLHKDEGWPWFLALAGATAFPLVALAGGLLLWLLRTMNIPKELYAQGRVIERIQTKEKLQAVVAFSLAADPELQCSTIIEEDLLLESSVELQYPPRHPTQAVLFDPYPSSPIPGRIVLAGATLATLVLPLLYLSKLLECLARIFV